MVDLQWTSTEWILEASEPMNHFIKDHMIYATRAERIILYNYWIGVAFSIQQKIDDYKELWECTNDNVELKQKIECLKKDQDICNKTIRKIKGLLDVNIL